MLASFPGPEIFAGVTGWSIEQIGNDNLEFHARLMRKEMSYAFVRLCQACMRLAPRIVESRLRKIDRPPYYRQLFILRRQTEEAAKSSSPANGKSHS
jgi:hypothetical protein